MSRRKSAIKNADENFDFSDIPDVSDATPYLSMAISVTDNLFPELFEFIEREGTEIIKAAEKFYCICFTSENREKLFFKLLAAWAFPHLAPYCRFSRMKIACEKISQRFPKEPHETIVCKTILSFFADDMIGRYQCLEVKQKKDGQMMWKRIKSWLV